MTATSTALVCRGCQSPVEPDDLRCAICAMVTPHVAVLLRSLRTQRVALSAHVLAYRYNGHSHRAIVHGQNVQYTFGKAPYSVVKIALTVVGALLTVAALVALVAWPSTR